MFVSTKHVLLRNNSALIGKSSFTKCSTLSTSNVYTRIADLVRFGKVKQLSNEY